MLIYNGTLVINFWKALNLGKKNKQKGIDRD